MMNKKYIWIVLVTILVILTAVCWISINNIMKTYDRNLSQLTINNVDLSKVQDGTYEGSYKLFPIYVKVEVHVKNHIIEEIKILEHQNGQGKPAEAIPDKVIEAQSTKVDIIVGATGSSKVILKAIENALSD
jgi:uncharacterized protein with FMN-binding domain